MQRMCERILVVGLIVFLAGWAQAQQAPSQPAGGLDGFQGLLLNEDVQKELDLSAEQLKKLKKVPEQVAEKHRKDFQRLRELPAAQARKKTAELLRTIFQETTKAMFAVLNSEQIKRLKQIELQERGLRAFSDPEVEEALQLTEGQKKALQKIGEKAGKEMQRIFREGSGDSFEELEKKRVALRKQTVDSAVNLLSNDQFQAWKELTGEPFEVKWRRPSASRPAEEEM